MISAKVKKADSSHKSLMSFLFTILRFPLMSRSLSIPTSKDDNVKPIIIEKNDAILQILKQKVEKGFTPTSLNKFRNCGLQFYFSEVINLRENEEVEETIEAATLGTVIHHVLHELYKPYLNKRLTEGNILEMLSNLQKYRRSFLMNRRLIINYQLSTINYQLL